MTEQRLKAHKYLEQHPDTSTRELQEALGLAERSARRYRNQFLNGFTEEIKVTSAAMQDYEPDEEWDLDWFFEWAANEVATRQLRNPIITHDIHTFDVDRPIGVMFVSCVHLGGVYTRYDQFKDLYEQALKISGLYWGMLGDEIEGFPEWFRDVPAIRNQLLTLDRQRSLLKAVLSPISELNKLLFGASSQHGDKWVKSRTGENPVKSMYMQDFHVPFYDGPAYLKFRVGKQEYKVAVAHEFPGRSATNPTYAQKRALITRFPLADVVVMGDKHNYAHSKETVYQDEFEAGDRASNKALLLQVGTLKTGPDSFAVEHGFPKGSFGWPIVIFDHKEHAVRLAETLDDAKLMLA